jgi:hypothetical protein
VLERVVDRLRPIPARRKAIVWFSRGGELPANWETNLEIGQPIGRNEEALRSLIERARAANVAIYTVDPRGLVAPSTGGRDNPASSPTSTRSARHRDLAAATGGRAIVNTNDIDDSLQRVSVENRAYYLLGYEPARDGRRSRRPEDSRRHARAGVELLHRSIYLPGAAAASGSGADRLAAAGARSAIALAPAAVAIDRRSAACCLPFEIGRDLRDDTEVEYSAIALGSGRQGRRARQWPRPRARTAASPASSGSAAESKTYQVRFAARASNPESAGWRWRRSACRKGKSKEPECAGIVFEQPGPGADGLRRFLARSADHHFDPGLRRQARWRDFIRLGAANGVPATVVAGDARSALANGLWRIRPEPQGAACRRVTW